MLLCGVENCRQAPLFPEAPRIGVCVCVCVVKVFATWNFNSVSGEGGAV